MKKQIQLFRQSILMLLFSFLVFSCKKKSGEVLPAPQSVTASNTYALRIVLDWDNVTGAEGYYIYRADYNPDTASLDFQKIGSSTENAYEDIGLVSQSAYYYKVEAYSGSASGTLSQAALGNTIELTPDEAFSTLALLTGGQKYDAALASDVPGIIIKIITENAQTGTDLIFLIDNTGSMKDDIDEVKSSLTTIINQLPANTRLGAATYNDANEDPLNWYQWKNFSTSYGDIKTFINSINVDGGGDIPESVYDGVYLTVDKMSWSSTNKRMIIVIGDAAPLEGDKTMYSLMQVVNKCKSMGVVANLYPLLIED